jgi:hypothetical protein
LQDDLLDNPKRRQLLVQAMQHRLGEIDKRRDAMQDPQRDAMVTGLLNTALQAVKAFAQSFAEVSRLRAKASKVFRKCTHDNNIRFDAMSRVSHVTDATDWRVEYPFVVLAPDGEADMARLVKACIDLGLTIVPRGGGTGYTGGAVPLTWKSVVINTEKLQKIGQVEMLQLPGLQHAFATIATEAGVVTQRVADAAEQAGFVFAVDP